MKALSGLCPFNTRRQNNQGNIKSFNKKIFIFANVTRFIGIKHIVNIKCLLLHIKGVSTV